MVRDILRFYREAPALLDSTDDMLTLGDYLQQQHYSQTFIDDHILPMACALWSGPPQVVKDFPVRYFVAFMANHQMLKTDNRPQWRTVCWRFFDLCSGISSGNLQGDLRLDCPVQAVSRNNTGVTVKTREGQEHYDHADSGLP